MDFSYFVKALASRKGIIKDKGLISLAHQGKKRNKKENLNIIYLLFKDY